MCRRAQGVVELPVDLEAAASHEVELAERSAKRRRSSSRALAAQLQHLSRSQARGGAQQDVARLAQAGDTPGGVRAAAAGVAGGAARPGAALTRQRCAAQEEGQPEAAAGPAAALCAPDRGGCKGAAARRGATPGRGRCSRSEPCRAGHAWRCPQGTACRSAGAEASAGFYQDPRAAVAYAVMRMPACYAAAAHVLHELRECRPDLQPGSMLDFGAGPGTATWAARQVIPAAPARQARALHWAANECCRHVQPGVSPSAAALCCSPPHQRWCTGLARHAAAAARCGAVHRHGRLWAPDGAPLRPGRPCAVVLTPAQPVPAQCIPAGQPGWRGQDA